MNDSRLTGLMLLTCEKDLTDTLDLEKVAKEWSLLKKRRVRIHYNLQMHGERFDKIIY